MQRGCRTFAPALASSCASAKESVRSRRASGTIRGLAVNIPGTSVQISNRSAWSRQAKYEPDVSEPPRPSSTVSPFGFWAGRYNAHVSHARFRGGEVRGVGRLMVLWAQLIRSARV
jgi:hypothetical protein|eukprot:SAG25_NODE_1689_length_2546_cov_1.377605_3_plen_116_part_00